MSDSPHIPLQQLIAYRFGELGAEEEAELEAHYFACDACTQTLSWLEHAGQAIVTAMRQGWFDVALTREAVERLEASGSVIRRYDLSPGDSVACTAAPGEDMTVVTLLPPLRPNQAVTVRARFVDPQSNAPTQLDYPVIQDQKTGEIVLAFAGAGMRALGHMQVSLSVHFGDDASGETVGPFTMNHSPWSE